MKWERKWNVLFVFSFVCCRCLLFVAYLSLSLSRSLACSQLKYQFRLTIYSLALLFLIQLFAHSLCLFFFLSFIHSSRWFPAKCDGHLWSTMTENDESLVFCCCCFVFFLSRRVYFSTDNCCYCCCCWLCRCIQTSNKTKRFWLTDLIVKRKKTRMPITSHHHNHHPHHSDLSSGITE